MSGSFSKSKQQSTSSSTSSSNSFGAQIAESFGVGGSSSVSSSVGSSGQSIAFEDLFSKLYGGATGAAAGIDTGGISDAAASLFSGGLSFLDRLGGGAGADELAARVSDTSARDAQLATLKTSLGDFFNENLVPGITSRGVSTGTLGGSRDAVELAAAAKAVSGQFATGASSIIAQDQAARDAAAGKLADVTNAGAGTGLSALASLYGLAQGGATAGLLPYQQLAAILGGPTTLTSSSQVSDALASSFSNQGSSSYGFNTASANSESQSQATGSAFSVSGGVGFNLGQPGVGGKP